MKIRRIGLTGSIASGKSTVAARMREHGVPVIDLDLVAHDLMKKGGVAYGPIVREFGDAILGPSGEIDRKALGAIVFSDARARERLNAIVHPRVRDEEQRRVEDLVRRGHRVVVTEAALLIESGQAGRFDDLVVVGTDEATQRERLMRRDGIGAAEATRRMRAQMSFEEKRRFATRVIETSGSLDDLRSRVDEYVQGLEG